MKVLYFHQHFSTPKGTTGIRSYEMARKLIAKGHQVTMVCGSYSEGNTELTIPFVKGIRNGNVDGINVIEFNLKYSNNDNFTKRVIIFSKFALKSIKIALVEKYDVLFATTTPLTAAIPGIFARWVRNKRFIFEVRDLWPELPREMGVITNPLVLASMELLEWVAYKSAHALIGLSPGILSGIERLNIPKEKITMIPNGCDLELFENNLKEKWQPEGINDDDFMAIYSGTHGVANGLNIVIDVARLLKKQQRYDIKFVLVGQGRLKSNLIQAAKDASLDNIIFLDPVNKSELSKLFARANVGMQLLANVPAFYYGTSPNKFFDYIASGLPVINNYPGWLADMINEHKCGLVVEPESPELFKYSLINMADNRQQQAKMRDAARRLAETKFSRQMLSEDFVNWLVKWGSPDDKKAV